MDTWLPLIERGREEGTVNAKCTFAWKEEKGFSKSTRQLKSQVGLANIAKTIGKVPQWSDKTKLKSHSEAGSNSKEMEW